jgi:hypothetical protein
VKIAPGVIEGSFETFRSCGAGRDECVVYWSGSLDAPGLVDRFHHPQHTAGPFGYDVDGAWLTDFLPSLSDEGRTVRVQVHTHPTSTFHSSRDDGMALMYVAGFLSLVIPDFGLGEPTLDRSYMTVLDKSGLWQVLDPYETLEPR